MEEENGYGIEEDVQSDSTENESLVDSDYDFRDDEDDVIFKKSVVDADKELEKAKETAETVVDESKNEGRKNEQKKPVIGGAFRQQNRNDTTGDFNLYDGENIQVHEESESMNSEELNSNNEASDEDSSKRRKPRYVRFRLEHDMVDPKFFVGLLFDDKRIFKQAVDYYGVKWGKHFRWGKNDTSRMRAKCNSANCGWFIYASKEVDSDAFVIRTMGPSCNCGRTFHHKRANSGFLSRHYMDFLRLNKRVSVTEFKEKVHLELNVNITRDQVSKTFMKAKLLIYGSYKQQYTKLWDYCEELLNCNPGSTIHMETTVDDISGKERFQKIYICFEALKKGFKAGCRQLIGLDGCHLRGPHPGVLLTAVGIDANDCIYPIAYAVVEIENKSSWKWFMEFLKHDLCIHEQKTWTFISDRQKVITIFLFFGLPKLQLMII